MDSYDIERKYKDWWEHHWVRLMPGCGPWRKAFKVEFIGPPSGVYGAVRIDWDDTGKNYNFVAHGNSFRPRKTDMECIQLVCETCIHFRKRTKQDVPPAGYEQDTRKFWCAKLNLPTSKDCTRCTRSDVHELKPELAAKLQAKVD